MPVTPHMSAGTSASTNNSRPLSRFSSLSFGSKRLTISNPSLDPAPQVTHRDNGHVITSAISLSNSKFESFCAHPIRSTSHSFRKLMRRASSSVRTGNEKDLTVIGGSSRKGLVPESTLMGDAESGIVLDEKDIDDSFYAASAVRVDFVDLLPAEITAHILSYLDHRSLINCEYVSRNWREASTNRHVWRNVFREEHGPWKSSPGKDWKKMFSVRKELDARWQKAEVTLKYLKGHQDSVYCVQFDNTKIITGSRDKTIRVWDINTGECQRVLGHGPVQTGSIEQTASLKTQSPAASGGIAGPRTSSFGQEHHSASVLCLQFDKDILVSGSSDHTCIMWSLPSFVPIGRLRGHTAGVLDVCLDEKHIVSCSKDTSICVWDRSRPGRLIRQIHGHKGPVNAVAIRGDLIVSASGDALIKLWNLRTGRCIREFKGHSRGLACVQFSEDASTIVSGGNDQDIRIWDAQTGECLKVLTGHTMLVRTLHLDSKNRRIISGSYDQSVKVWNLDTGKMILDIKQFHSTWILSAKADYKRIISTSQDTRTLMLDFSAGVEGLELLDN